MGDGRGGDGGNGTFLSQESTKEPVVHGCWLHLKHGSLYEKGFGIRSVSKLTLGFQAPFSVCFANPDGFAVRTAAVLTCALLPPFRCGETSGDRAAAREGGWGNAACGQLHLITAFGGADTIRHCHEVNKSSLHSVPHWNFIRLYLPKGSGEFRSPSRGRWGAKRPG